MHEEFQKTIKEIVTFNGIGLHSGQKSRITIYPGKNDQGIIFKRTDLKENNLIKANFKNVSSAKLCTTLENSHGVKVSTVEHLLAAFYIFGIDNALIEINCEEVPIMDGSAKDFLEVLENVGLSSLTSKRKYLKVLEKFEFIDGQRKISVEPNENFFEVDFELNYKNDIIGKQRNIVNFQKNNLKDVSSSRTFCLFEDIEKIKKAGLAKGGSLENAVVIKNDKVLNDGGLRNSKEFVNHKILDLAGDFLLSGYRVLGKIKCIQGGHELTNTFLRKLFSNNSSIEITENVKSFISKDTVIKPSIKIAVNA
jgi:UDP-3-O-[3-hydroxymyristoyl] N-acetylglucosamine deacetylase